MHTVAMLLVLAACKDKVNDRLFDWQQLLQRRKSYHEAPQDCYLESLKFCRDPPSRFFPSRTSSLEWRLILRRDTSVIPTLRKAQLGLGFVMLCGSPTLRSDMAEAKGIGSSYLRKRVEELKPDVHAGMLKERMQSKQTCRNRL